MATQKLQVIVTGATGMVGEGVLHEALLSSVVEKVLIINRKPSGMQHEKLTEIIHKDFFNLEPIADQLIGYSACFFCMGVSSVGMKEPEYFRLTHTLTMHMASLLSSRNPQMTFCYVSGAGTDSSENGRQMWARVKGKTENDLVRLPFKAVFNFRPGILEPTKGLNNTLSFYKYTQWLLSIIKTIAPKYICSLPTLGQGMIAVSTIGYPKNILEVSDIKKAAAGSLEQ